MTAIDLTRFDIAPDYYKDGLWHLFDTVSRSNYPVFSGTEKACIAHSRKMARPVRLTDGRTGYAYKNHEFWYNRNGRVWYAYRILNAAGDFGESVSAYTRREIIEMIDDDFVPKQ